MNSVISTFASLVLNKYVMILALIAIFANTGINFAEKWAVGIVPASAQELLDLQDCSAKTDNQNLKEVISTSMLKSISKAQAQDLLEKCSN